MTDERSANGEARTESLAEAIDRLARQLEGVERRPVGKAIEYSRAGVVFAAREDGRLSFRLREEVVGAALRTLDTGSSARGADWISLSGAIADQFALDRAVAWFESAWRLAGPASERAQPH
jgi:hypothetical protein